jgi:hypothetical protein
VVAYPLEMQPAGKVGGQIFGDSKLITKLYRNILHLGVRDPGNQSHGRRMTFCLTVVNDEPCPYPSQSQLVQANRCSKCPMQVSR